jgi:hypothetical protein
MYPKSREANIRSTCQNIPKFDTNRYVITNAHKSTTLIQILSHRNQAHNTPPIPLESISLFPPYLRIFLQVRYCHVTEWPQTMFCIDDRIYLTLTEGNYK